jgi:glutamine amidotransferase-like uncharacterized protein
MNNPYEPIIASNQALSKGRPFFLRVGADGLSLSADNGRGSRPLPYPAIGVYAGGGSSHSWLWFAEIFDRLGFFRLRFLDERDVRTGLPSDLDVFTVSGGDTFAVARALGRSGSERIETFVRRGGLYIGTCAGAYLPLCSSKEDLRLFNFVQAKISNLSRNLPEPKRMAHKFRTAYGCEYVFHPVREDVALRATGVLPFPEKKHVIAPMYGGPGMTTADDMEILLEYERFTPKTQFLVDEALAGETLLGKAAVIRSRLGQGKLLLFGPHFEHPGFPEANAMLSHLIYWDVRSGRYNAEESQTGPKFPAEDAGKRFTKDIRRELSNSRIVATGMELLPLRWKIGAKVYEPEKLRVFLEALWKRLRYFERMPFRATEEEMHALSESAKNTTKALRRLRSEVDSHADATEIASECFQRLHVLSIRFLNLYFRNRSESGVMGT